MEPAFAVLYDEARAALVTAYEEADSAVLSFAIEHDLSNSEVWDLIREEASLQGDSALEYLAEHPLEERSPLHGLAEPAAMLAGQAAMWAWKKWSDRRAK